MICWHVIAVSTRAPPAIDLTQIVKTRLTFTDFPPE
jgi:hypothetical protein